MDAIQGQPQRELRDHECDEAERSDRGDRDGREADGHEQE